MSQTNINPVARQRYLIPESLTHNSGIITAVVFGQSYTVNVGTPAANTLFFLYLNAGSLISTTTVPSTYRSTNPNANLIGAWYSNGLATPAWGSFVNIEGVPKTSRISYDIKTTGGTQAWGTITADAMSWERIGNRIFVSGRLTLGVRTAVEGRLGMPFTATDLPSPNENVGTVGYGATTSVTYGLLCTSGISYVIGAFNTGGAGMLSGQIGTAIFADSTAISPSWSCPISGWSNAPLKDL